LKCPQNRPPPGHDEDLTSEPMVKEDKGEV